MFIEVTTPGGFELLFEAAKKALEQVPAMLQLLSTAPVYVIQALLIVLLLFGINPICNFIEKIMTFLKWFNDKL